MINQRKHFRVRQFNEYDILANENKAHLSEKLNALYIKLYI